MALGTRLTLLDYLGTQKRTANLATGQALFRGVNLAVEENFDRMFSSCLGGKKSQGLTAADYLANPVKTKTKVCLELEAFKSGRDATQISEKPFELIPTETAREISLKQGQQNTEKNSILFSDYEKIERSIEKAAQDHGLPYDLIKGVIRAESDFQVRAKSPAGALGLMQLMPATAKELGVQDPFNIDQNIDAGTRYLKKMMVRFGNDTKKALAAYNSGPGTVERYGGRVPYKETRQYVDRVLEFSGLTV